MAVRPDVVGIIVRDMATALRFYRLLGLDPPAGSEVEPHVEFTTPTGWSITWDTEELITSIYPGWTAPTGQRVTLAIHCDTPGEVDALFQSIVDHGFAGHKPPWDAFWGQRYAVVADPDGTLIDLYAPSARD